MTDNTISLCMIVKNEEAHIEQCLKSVHDIVDEIVIVDTGSTDQTVEICKKYTKNIHSFQWNQNFSEARNESIQRAKSKWILWLDGDEELDRENIDNLKAALSQKKEEAILYVPIINYIGKSVQEEDAYNIYQPRIFRNGKKLVFQNRIHETLEIPNAGLVEDTLDVPIKHYGYLDSFKTSKKKHDRNLSLLKIELNNEKHSPWVEYHAASEYYNAKNYEKAFHFVNYAILKFIEHGLIPPAIVYRLKYAILIDSNNIDGAWPSINQAILLYPDYVDLYYIKGTVLFHLKKYEEAVEALDQCLKLGEDNHKYLILKGAGSFRATELKEQCLEQLTVK
ncbi:TPR domain-containing glycosyltransferase [Shouchella tritolerans]|uniref:TPR domain-containing glycosyltransferase n=1 Tax=Shouchella tritolerans TaxID=2979466 RepID=UPI0021E6ED18|nr:TPR domain-containing glycosyltransferase [Shouchella tritolerans]